ncbi:hypothetical protein IMY05_006G0147500 [Salix suchowensis]|nr:hypothetical protein IMY05_006G0147500 [Salix suchowensis]
MTPMRPVFTFLLLSLLLLSMHLPSSAASDEVLTKSQLPQGRQNDKKSRSYRPRTSRKSSAIRTQISPGHVIGSVFTLLGFSSSSRPVRSALTCMKKDVYFLCLRVPCVLF